MNRRRDSGQSAVELAILLPLLLLILLGCLDLGRAFSVWVTITNGAREGAHYASYFPTETDAIREETQADIVAEGLSAGALNVEVTTPHGTEGGQPVNVTAAYTFSLVTTYLFGGHPISIRSTTTMAILEGGS